MNDLALNDYFRELAEKAGLQDPRAFIAGVSQRLQKGATEYADNPAAKRPIAELVHELAEELEDVGGWGSQIHRHPEMEHLSTIDREHARMILIDIALGGLRLRQETELLLGFLDEARARAPKPNPEPVGCRR